MQTFSTRGASGVCFLVAVFMSAGCTASAGDPMTEQDLQTLLAKAAAAFGAGRAEEALRLAGEAIDGAPSDPRPLSLRASMYESERDFKKALADFDRLVRSWPEETGFRQKRGVVRFKRGDIEGSIEDFDAVVKASPDRDAHHWQRGISYYYAGRFDEGRRQFERHRAVNPNDVENAVWHFLCVAKAEGLDKAREALIPIRGDGRVPMAEVHRLFAGTATASDVLAAAEKNASPAQLTQQRFYAHLYIALYLDATGKKTDVRKHLDLAANKYAIDHYMCDVARVHLGRLELENETID